MKVGFKTGPKSWKEGLELIEKHGARYSEIWYRYDWSDRYDDFFQVLKKYQVSFGLHYWALLANSIYPSLCFDEPIYYNDTIQSMKGTIDVAAKRGAAYVVVHPGARTAAKINDQYDELTLLAERVTPLEKAEMLLNEAVAMLDAYAKERNVLFLVETLPAKDAVNWHTDTGRLKTLESHQTSITSIQALAEKGYHIANDFGHTSASQPNEDTDIMWQSLYTVTKKLAAQTKLLHINTVRPPFNGTDSHDGILESDWQNNVFPNEDPFLRLLSLFKDRDDVWAVPEPQDGAMIPNYLALRRYVNKK